ncbi:MAG: squalene synthase HpnC [Herminiimonas sp.]|nr:squalene synthase HpnC [Herminiimonas sp.]
MPIDHYENFPVASLLLPARLRPAVHAIYAFARTADDIADEGDALLPARLAALDAYDAMLLRMPHEAVAEPVLFRNLQQVITQWDLPLQPFQDLLSAFKQDVVTTRYADFPALLDYCTRSANPVGTLMLYLYECPTPDNLRWSDAICSALQLINFWQDVAVDWQKGRVYLPQDDLQRHGVTEAAIDEGRVDAAWRSLMRFEVARARTMLLYGSPLALRLPGRIGWELRLVVQGGLRILARIETAGYDVFQHRPVLGKRDWISVAYGAVRMSAAAPYARNTA